MSCQLQSNGNPGGQQMTPKTLNKATKLSKDITHMTDLVRNCERVLKDITQKKGDCLKFIVSGAVLSDSNEMLKLAVDAQLRDNQIKLSELKQEFEEL